MAKKAKVSKKSTIKKAVVKKSTVKKAKPKMAVAKAFQGGKFRPVCITEEIKLGSWTSSEAQAIVIAKAHEDATGHVANVEEKG